MVVVVVGLGLLEKDCVFAERNRKDGDRVRILLINIWPRAAQAWRRTSVEA